MARWLPLLVLLLAGCGPMNGPRLDDGATAAYEAALVRVTADEPTALAAVERYVSSMGWSVDRIDAADARVVAHVDTRDARSLQRDTWTFQVRPGFVIARRSLALGDSDGAGMITSDDVCGTYTYAAELDHLAHIAALIDEEAHARRLARR
jgi:hypothetical protein